MSVRIIDGETILNFVNNDAAFTAAARRRFAELDTDGDGLLSYSEMIAELQSLAVTDLSDGTGFDEHDDPAKLAELYRALFEQYDRDSDGAVGPEEYVAETREMMVGIAAGMGFQPLQMVLADNSLLQIAHDLETH